MRISDLSGVYQIPLPHDFGMSGVSQLLLEEISKLRGAPKLLRLNSGKYHRFPLSL
jgi:hypothetical protein